MHRSALRSRVGNEIEASIVIRRPIQKVFQFYCDFRNLPKFLGDVMDVKQTGPNKSRWTIYGPFGVHETWTIKVTHVQTNVAICYETVTEPWRRTYWEVHFSVGSSPNETAVRELLRPPLGWIGRKILELLGKSPHEEVSANLRRLKQLLETGFVSDFSWSVADKFPPSGVKSALGAPVSPHSEPPIDPEIAALRAALKEGWLFEDK